MKPSVTPNVTTDTALDCLAAVLQSYGLPADMDALARQYGLDAERAGLDELKAAAVGAGFKAKVRRISFRQLEHLRSFLPAVAVLENGNCVILHDADVQAGKVAVADPLAESSRPFEVEREVFEKSWSGWVMALLPRRESPLLRCFVMQARQRGVELTREGLARKYALPPGDPPLERLMRIASEEGFKVRQRTAGWKDLQRAGEVFPMIALTREGGAVLLAGFHERDGKVHAEIAPPYAPHLRRESWDRAHFMRATGGRVLVFKRKREAGEPRKFGLGWFVPEFARQKRAFLDVAVAAVLLQVLALAMPLYFQIVVDKVLVHHAVSTLHMLGVGMVCVLLFDLVFSWLRGYMLLYATSKIDIRVATRTFARLLRLPMLFFDSARAGVVVKHMQQADRIRQFLSGKLFFTILDSFALFVLLPLLFFYSWKLALVVLGFSLLTTLVIAALVPLFRKRLTALYMAEGARQAHLVETIQGMATVKSLALEPSQRLAWDAKSADAVLTGWSVGRISVAANSLTTFLEKSMSLAIPWLGVFMVFDGTLTVGALIAFQMLAGRVSAPLVQMVSLIHEYQETALSIRMLGNVMNHEPERPDGQGGLTPDIHGDVVFENVSFSYRQGGSPALDNVSLHIPPGSMVGVVGRSGSGKSTLVRLLCGLYPCSQGAIRMDGCELRDMDLGHLRRSVGMVLQENFLFSGTVRENIAMPKTDATFEEVVRAARLSGAHEFIARLPQGYDTMLEENGANLSGGQRQRLAIARTLISDPRILVFDEATSSLDAESEAIIQQNLGAMAERRTTIMISHRLSMLTRAAMILVMEKGRIVAAGTHEELLDKERGSEMYRMLWYTQNRHLLERGRDV